MKPMRMDSVIKFSIYAMHINENLIKIKEDLFTA